jgi:hypothetical protein
MRHAPQPDAVILRADSEAGDHLELEMPAWAIGAIRRGQAVVYRGDRSKDWTRVGGESGGGVTRRLPLDQTEWHLLPGDRPPDVAAR